MTLDSAVPAFSAPYAEQDEDLAAGLLAGAALDAEAEARIDRRALHLIAAVRTQSSRIGGVQNLLREYSLSSEEGLALMVLANPFSVFPTISPPIGSSKISSHPRIGAGTREIRKRS